VVRAGSSGHQAGLTCDKDGYHLPIRAQHTYGEGGPHPVIRRGEAEVLVVGQRRGWGCGGAGGAEALMVGRLRGWGSGAGGAEARVGRRRGWMRGERGHAGEAQAEEEARGVFRRWRRRRRVWRQKRT